MRQTEHSIEKVGPTPAKAKAPAPAQAPMAAKGAAAPFPSLSSRLGNQATQHLLRSGLIKPKLRVSQPGDPQEIEADRMASIVAASSAANTIHRKCACAGTGTRCPACDEQNSDHTKPVMRMPTSSSARDDEVREDFVASLGPGQSLDSSTRSSMEPFLGRDFSDVRIHTDAASAEAANNINAVAFATGNHIYFGRGSFNPTSEAGRGILAHELTHVAQWGARHKTNSPAADKSGVAHSAQIMRLTPAEFQKQLGATDEQKAAIAALFANKTFLDLWNYLKKCTVAAQDLGPLALKVTPGLKIGGVERYGGYSPISRTLEINPTKPEHKANPSELVDTITHELIHAVDDLADDCKKAGAGTAPLAGAATSTAPSRTSVAGTEKEKQLMLDQGPGASNPCDEFIDINKAAQQIVIQIIRGNIKVAKVGRPTVIFVNEILRQDPKAMKAYIACRDVACAKAKHEDRQKEIAKCSADIIDHYMPKSLAP